MRNEEVWIEVDRCGGRERHFAEIQARDVRAGQRDGAGIVVGRSLEDIGKVEIRPHGVSAGRQPGERVGAVDIGDGRGLAGLERPVAVKVEEDATAEQSRFAEIPRAVGV